MWVWEVWRFVQNFHLVLSWCFENFWKHKNSPKSSVKLMFYIYGKWLRADCWEFPWNSHQMGIWEVLYFVRFPKVPYVKRRCAFAIIQVGVIRLFWKSNRSFFECTRVFVCQCKRDGQLVLRRRSKDSRYLDIYIHCTSLRLVQWLWLKMEVRFHISTTQNLKPYHHLERSHNLQHS